MPVSTSLPQFGQVAVAMLPTMKVNSHSGQEIRGEGRAGGGGALGGRGAVIPPPGGIAPGASRTTLTDPQAGHPNRPGPGTSN